MNTLTGHIVRSYDQELAQISTLTAQMGGLVEQQLQQSLRALHARDNELAAKTYENDNSIDSVEQEINDLSLKVLALRQPMASDLRLIVGSMKIARDLERIGDYAASLAKRSYALNSSGKLPLSASLLRLGNLVAPMVLDAIAAYSSIDVARAEQILDNDAPIDDAYDRMVGEIITHMQTNPDDIKLCTHVLFMAKNLERIGDRCTNIAETVFFMDSGSTPKAPRRPNLAEKLARDTGF